MSEKKPKKKKTAGDVILTVILIAAICVFCYAGYNLFHIYTEYKKGTDEYNHIAQMAVTERDPEEAAEPTAEGGLEAPMNIDFKSLKSVNDGFMWKLCRILIIRLSMERIMRLTCIILMKKTIILQVPYSWIMRIKGILMTVIPLSMDII